MVYKRTHMYAHALTRTHMHSEIVFASFRFSTWEIFSRLTVQTLSLSSYRTLLYISSLWACFCPVKGLAASVWGQKGWADRTYCRPPRPLHCTTDCVSAWVNVCASPWGSRWCEKRRTSSIKGAVPVDKGGVMARFENVKGWKDFEHIARNYRLVHYI
jgi:hypothetical protein